MLHVLDSQPTARFARGLLTALDCIMGKSAAKEFQLALARDLAEEFSGDPTFEASKLVLRWRTDVGFNVISLAGSNKWSPFVSVNYYFGCSFNAVSDIERRVRKHPSTMHIANLSVNMPLMKGLGYSGPSTWQVNIHERPPNLIEEMAESIRGIANPFFARFSSMRAARDALEADDSWCFGGGFSWGAMLYIDAALSELDHFERWMTIIPDYQQNQAQSQLEAVRALPPLQSNTPQQRPRSKQRTTER